MHSTSLQVRKCDDAACPYHKPLFGQETIRAFPDPVPSEFHGVLHYHERVDPKEKILQFVLKNVKKPRLVHSKLKLKREESKGVQKIMKKLSFMCGA